MHDGGLYGFPSTLLMDNDNKIGIIVLSNTHDAPVYLSQDGSISKNLYEIVGKALLKSNENSHLQWEEYENTYSDEFWSNFYVTEVSGELAIINLNTPFPLKNMVIFKHIGNDSFKESLDYRWNIGETVINFERDAENKIISLISVNNKLYPKY